MCHTLSSGFRSRRGSVDESYEWESYDSAYVQMHPVDPKVSLSKAGLRRDLLGQGQLCRSTKDEGRPDLDLKQKGKINACFVYFISFVTQQKKFLLLFFR